MWWPYLPGPLSLGHLHLIFLCLKSVWLGSEHREFHSASGYFCSEVMHVTSTLHFIGPKKSNGHVQFHQVGESLSPICPGRGRKWEILVSPHNVPGSYVVACKNVLQHFFRENYFFLQLMNISLSINGTLLL